MSTETAPIETKETPAVNPAQGITVNLFGGKKVAKETPAETQEVAKEAPTETPTETPKEAVTEQPKEPKKKDPETNLAAMRKKLEEIEANAKAAAEERDRLKEEYEQFKSKPIELPEDVKTKLSAVEKYEKELQEARAIVRQTNLARDPEFRAKYDVPIQNRIKAMAQVAAQAGVSESEIQSAVRNWNKDRFGEWIDTMTPGQRIEFQAAWQKAEELYIDQQEQLQNADRTWADLEKQRKEAIEAQQKEVLTANERLARDILKQTLARGDAASYEGITEAAEAVLMKAARYEMSPQEVFEQLAANQVLARATQKQAESLKERDAKIAELEKKLAEQEQFISSQAGSVPRTEAAGTTGKTGETYVPPWKRLVVG